MCNSDDCGAYIWVSAYILPISSLGYTLKEKGAWVLSVFSSLVFEYSSKDWFGRFPAMRFLSQRRILREFHGKQGSSLGFTTFREIFCAGRKGICIVFSLVKLSLSLSQQHKIGTTIQYFFIRK